MRIPTVIDLVRDNQIAEFKFYRTGELWYEVAGFQFPVPVSDTGDGVFNSREQALMLMRWIRKHVQYLNESRAEESAK